MSMKNTRNLIQTEGGRTIKQADKGSTLTFLLVDEKRNVIEGINGNLANITLYDKEENKKWSTSATVSNYKVSFNLPGNLSVGIYDLDITVGSMVFPSDRGTKIEVVEGYALSGSNKLATELIINIDNYVKKNDLAQYTKTTDMEAKLSQKVDKISGKGLSTNDYTNSERGKVQAIPSNPKYTDTNTTYKAGDGLSLSGTTFSVNDTIARKTDIPSLEGYAKLTDVPKIDAITGSIDLSGYATKAELNNKVDKVSGKGLSTNDYTNTDKAKVMNIPTSGAKYTDTTYSAGNGLSLSGTTFSIDSTVAKKADIPSLEGYAKLTDIDTKLGEIDLSNIDLSGYALKNDLTNKVDKVNGKGLSSNDFTNAYKTKLDGLSNPDLSGYALKADLNNKVDKVSGKGLSTNDFTSTDKEKLSRVFEPEEILVYNGSSVIQKIYMINGVISYKARVDKTATRIGFPWNRVKHIPDNFCMHTNVTSVDLYGVRIIEESAFYDSQLSGKLKIPGSAAFVGDSCFSNNNLEEIEYYSTASILIQTFAANQITKIKLHEGLSFIGVMAFQSNKLTEVDIPKSVKHVADYAFDRNPIHTVRISRYTSFDPKSFPSTANIIYKD